MSLGSRLAEQRAAHRLAQAEAARLGGVSREMWGKYEREAARPGADVLAALAKAGWDVDYILTGTPARLRYRFSALPVATEMARLAARDEEEFSRLQTAFFEALIARSEMVTEEDELLANYRWCDREDQEQIRKLAERLTVKIR